MTASGPGHGCVRGRLFLRIYSAASRAGAGAAAAEGTSVRKIFRTSGPQKNICQKKAMGKLQTTVWSQTGMNSMPGR